MKSCKKQKVMMMRYQNKPQATQHILKILNILFLGKNS